MKDEIGKINYRSLISILDFLTKSTNVKDESIISIVFEENIIGLEETFKQFMTTETSDIIVCYGRNSPLIKTIFNHIIVKNKNDKIDLKCLKYNAKINIRNDVLYNEIETELKTKIVGLDLLDNDSYISPDFYTYKKKLIIFFENVDCLFDYQKDKIFYTLLELISKHKNIFVICTCSVFNIIDQMDKRVRSRFSQKIIFIQVNSFKNFVDALQSFYMRKTILDLETSCVRNFIEILVKNDEFRAYFERIFNLNFSVQEIFIKLKLLLANILYNLQNENEYSFVDEEKFKSIIRGVIIKLNVELNILPAMTILKNQTKINLICYLALVKAIKKYNEPVTLSLIYCEYVDFCKKSEMMQLEILQFRKSVEELCQLNIIYPKKDSRYNVVYDSKYFEEEIFTSKSDLFLNYDLYIKTWFIN